MKKGPAVARVPSWIKHDYCTVSVAFMLRWPVPQGMLHEISYVPAFRLTTVDLLPFRSTFVFEMAMPCTPDVFSVSFTSVSFGMTYSCWSNSQLVALMTSSSEAVAVPASVEPLGLPAEAFSPFEPQAVKAAASTSAAAIVPRRVFILPIPSEWLLRRSDVLDAHARPHHYTPMGMARQANS